MTGDIAISALGLWKEYRIGTAQAATSLRDEIGRLLRRPFRGAADDARIWALRDLSFEVAPGEVVGICGRNGAGKSTLLRILSRVTEPTRGRARLRGRVSSLLEVGTGFHHELTGRENIFLNGALLGMKRAEVERQLDAIVAFSGVARFLDTPVKHYSTGMQARLGFAVAAHLQQDILILDEVLAVGDADFQRQCLAKVHDIARHGKTILMVSHNMFAIERFCSRALLLVEGRIQDSGPPARIIEQYLAETAAPVRDSAKAGDEIVVHSLRATTDAGPGRLRGTLQVQIDIECLADLDHLDCGISIANSLRQTQANATARFGALGRGHHRLVIETANPGFPPGDYTLSFAGSRRGRWMKLFGHAATFRIPTSVTDDPHLLQFLDFAGVALEVKSARILPPEAPASRAAAP